ncbi:MAG: hypothetical protein JSU66_15810 [Deltaproteobacteria bacterium]|nr:MAG: hypothetical protein JSU66_15810 [Deltaproteobacteria bacterium]
MRLTDVLDVSLVALILWAGIVWLRHTRARLALIGVMIVAAVYLAARRLDLELTAWILQGFFAVLVLILVVVFQDDLRRLFEQLAVWGLRRKPPATPLGVIDTLARAVARLAETRTGGLIVIPGREPLERHVERLADDHRNARRLAVGLERLGLVVDPAPETNIVMFRVDDVVGFVRSTRARALLVNPLGGDRMRAVTHLDVGPEDVDDALGRIEESLREGAR